MYITTDSEILLNLDNVILARINHLTMARDDRYKLNAITTNIYEKSRQPNHMREKHIRHRPAEISPYSVKITEGNFKDCKKFFDKISEQDNFIGFTQNQHQNEYPVLLNLNHIITLDIKQNQKSGNLLLRIMVNNFSGSSELGEDYGSCHFPSFSPYDLTFSDQNGYDCKEIIDKIKENISILN